MREHIYIDNLLKLLYTKLSSSYNSNVREYTVDTLLNDVEDNIENVSEGIVNNHLQRSIILSKYINDNDNMYDFYNTLTPKELEILYLYM
jgi:hypothetical protein